MRRSHPAGQAASDYVALLALVAAVLTVAAAATGALPSFAGTIAGAIRHGICIVTGSVCTSAEAVEAGLEACPVHVRGDTEQVGARVVVVRLRRGEVAVIEERSDGTASVTFSDDTSAGLEGGIGVVAPPLEADLRAEAGVRFVSGEVHELPSVAAARRFLARHAARESLRGEAERLCPVCGRDDAPEPPVPSARFVEGGAYGELAAGLGLEPETASRGIARDLGLEADAAMGAIVGRRVEGPRTTWYARLDGAATGRLGAVLGAVQSARRDDAVLEVTLERGRAVDLRVRGAASLAGALDLNTLTSTLPDLAGEVRAVTGLGSPTERSGYALEASVGLDLTDPANHRAALDVLSMLKPGTNPLEADDRLRALAERLDAEGAIDLRFSRLETRERGREVGVGLGLGLGGELARSSEVRTLVGAWSARAGGPLQERRDCLEAEAA